MNNVRALVLYSFSFCIAGLTAGCGVADPIERADEAPVGQSSSSIKGGTKATSYPESALIAVYKGGGNQPTTLCSGSLIAPKVVLTAGHCADGYNKWVVSMPYAGGVEYVSTVSATYDYQGNGPMVNPNQHDIALIFLNTPIDLPSYPILAQSKLSNNSQVLNLGRIKDGQLSYTDMYVSQPVSAKDGADVGYNFDYYGTEIIEPGDSGGPVVLPGAAPHKIVAVNSGGGTGYELLARVDLIHSWIQDQINSHGGPGGGGGTGGSGSGGSGSGGGGGGGTPSSCTHDPCDQGSNLATDCDPCVGQVCGQDPYCCQVKWDGRCVEETESMCGLSCGGGGGGGQTCAHDPCEMGPQLAGDCDPCVSQICAQDAFCCGAFWDALCTFEVSSICGLTCN